MIGQEEAPLLRAIAPRFGYQPRRRRLEPTSSVKPDTGCRRRMLEDPDLQRVAPARRTAAVPPP
jgi:hypothetical protein